MSEFAPFIQVNLDYSLLQQAFNSINNKLKEHDEKFEEINKLMMAKADTFDFLQFKNKSEQSIAKLNNDEQSINEKQNNFDNKITEIEQLMKNLKNDTIESVKMELSAEGALPTTGERQGAGSMEDLLNRLAAVESKLVAAQRTTTSNDNTIQQIINQFNQLNTPQELKGRQIKENTPIDALKNTVSTVNNKFDQIFNALPGAMQSARSYGLENSNSEGTDPNIVNGNQVINNTTVIPHAITYPYEVDFASMRPMPSTTWSIEDELTLPPIHTFTNLSEPIEYIYNLVPSLQAILVGLRDALVGKLGGDSIVTKDAVDGMYQKLASAFKELVGEFSNLKDEMAKTATLDDVNAAFQSINIQDLPETSVGVVHCMTCGREMSQVAGALSYVDAVKTLGRAPTSYATRGKSGTGMQFSGRNTFDSAICESPRSVRSSRVASTIKVTRK